MMEQIESLIEDEVKRRMDTTMFPFIEYISTAYDISTQQLFKDYMLVMGAQRQHVCKGLTQKKKPCSRPAKDHGYCKMHQCQYKPALVPQTRVIMGASGAGRSSYNGRNNVVRDVASCFLNE